MCCVLCPVSCVLCAVCCVLCAVCCVLCAVGCGLWAVGCGLWASKYLPVVPTAAVAGADSWSSLQRARAAPTSERQPPCLAAHQTSRFPRWPLPQALREAAKHLTKAQLLDGEQRAAALGLRAAAVDKFARARHLVASEPQAALALCEQVGPRARLGAAGGLGRLAWSHRWHLLCTSSRCRCACACPRPAALCLALPQILMELPAGGPSQHEPELGVRAGDVFALMVELWAQVGVSAGRRPGSERLFRGGCGVQPGPRAAAAGRWPSTADVRRRAAARRRASRARRTA